MIETDVSLPLSKSMSNRALIMARLAGKKAPTFDVADCDDTEAITKALAATPEDGAINIGAAGTAMRFLTAYFAATPGSDVTLDGTERMRHRPIAPLVDALRKCGADIQYAGEEGFPPLKIKGQRLRGGDMEIDASISSQFISALLMVGPTFDSPLHLTLKGQIASLPYLDMTIEMMHRRGIDIEREHQHVDVKPGTYTALAQSDIERDWSAASYWYSIGALSAGWITLEGLTLPSLQGDSALARIFEKLGVITNIEDGNAELSASPEVFSRIDADLSDTPDIVQTLVVACCMLGVPFRFTGVASLRIKETDRIEALVKETAKFGCIINVENADTIRWDGKRLPIYALPQVDTYSDHRMAMAFAPAALYVPGLVIRDRDVVSKSYPTFWDDLEKAGFTLLDAAEPFDPQNPR